MKEQNSKNQRMLFVCRGSIREGVGHITRTRTVAEKATNFGDVHAAILGDTFMDTLLRESKFKYSFLKNDPEVFDLIASFDPDIIFLDMTYIDASVFNLIRKSRAIIVSLSPIFTELNHCDVFFHRTRVLPPDISRNRCNLIARCGLKYTIIPGNCRKITTEVFKDTLYVDRLSVAISMGGTDAANKTLQILEAIKGIKNKLIFWVLLGEGYAHSYQALVDCIKGSHHEVIFAKTNESMWRILSMCSVAILAGGVTTYEAAFAGLPSVNILENMEHKFLIQELVDRGGSIIAPKQFPEALSDLAQILDEFAEDRNSLLLMHEHLQGLIDNNGAERIIADVIEIQRQRLVDYEGSISNG